ncbi:MAG: hypothetical protein QOG20_5342 [Pseudonocardiales bacterium]|jgi:hypothetical protein|nr:hypothetical protein [Pseudonocardiales bacterium]
MIATMSAGRNRTIEAGRPLIGFGPNAPNVSRRVINRIASRTPPRSMARSNPTPLRDRVDRFLQRFRDQPADRQDDQERQQFRDLREDETEPRGIPIRHWPTCMVWPSLTVPSVTRRSRGAATRSAGSSTHFAAVLHPIGRNRSARAYFRRIDCWHMCPAGKPCSARVTALMRLPVCLCPDRPGRRSAR